MQMTSPGHGRPLRNQQGSVLALLLTVVAVIGIVSYVVMRLMAQVMNQLGDEDMQVEAQMLASDLKEYTKYLVTYEKIVFVKNPLKIGDGRRTKLETLWGQPYGSYDGTRSLNMLNVCGGYTVAAQFVGTLSAGSGDEVFCPHYLRDPNNTGKQTEDMLLDQWANKERVAIKLENNSPVKTKMAPVFVGGGPDGTDPLPEGQYRVKLDFSGSDAKWFVNADNSISMDVGQKIFEFLKDSNLKFALTADVDVDIFTDSFGMKSDFTERYMRVTSRITLDTAAKGKRIFIDQESFVLRIPTIKDFVIFIPYPTTAVGKPTTKMSESLLLGRKTQVNGRVYFNGDIDTALADLPEFLEPVFISGRLLTKVTNADTVLFRQKFRRGLITNLSMSRFLFDGSCPVKGNNPEILNGVGLMCSSGTLPYTIDNYLSVMNSVCRCSKLTIGANGVLNHGALLSTCADIGFRKNDCPNELAFVKSGYDEVEVAGGATHAFIASPIKKLKVSKAGATVMGVIVGGFIDALDGAKFVGITAMKTGMPGLGDAATLNSRTLEVNSIGAGVGAPIPNLPLIQFVKDGFK